GPDKAGKTNYVAKALDEILAGKPVSQSKTKPYGCNVKY
ncbi:MAG: thioredoxin family protein, partial [Phycisphaerae bacterium]|nr:thioredoxin family protein [Phycisphaerae bacterium]